MAEQGGVVTNPPLSIVAESGKKTKVYEAIAEEVIRVVSDVTCVKEKDTNSPAIADEELVTTCVKEA